MSPSITRLGVRSDRDLKEPAVQPDATWNEAENAARIESLRSRGVTVSSAARVFVSPEVPLAAIEPGAILLNASLYGETACIGVDSVVGREGHATLTDTQVGRDVVVGPGSYSGSVLFDRVRVRGFAELRPGTVLEEGVEIGHNVGLKNSFLTAHVVTGSCINFCDVFVTGGTSRAHHTEIGSGVIHFNFSPKRDKFASQFGDPSGLLGRAEPIFIGGLCGLIAPLHLAFGAVVPAGTTVRRWPGTDDSLPSDPFLRKCLLAARFVAALDATQAWYTQVRLAAADDLTRQLVHGALRQLAAHAAWRRTELLRYLERKRSNADPASLHAQVSSATQAMLQAEAPRARSPAHVSPGIPRPAPHTLSRGEPPRTAGRAASGSRDVVATDLERTDLADPPRCDARQTLRSPSPLPPWYP